VATTPEIGRELFFFYLDDSGQISSLIPYDLWPAPGKAK